MKKAKGIFILIFCILLAVPVVASANEPQDTYICEEYQKYICEISDMYCVSPELIMAMVEAESSGNPKATNKNTGCKGLMQIYEKWHVDRMERLGVTDLYDPYSNILVGVDYLMELAEEYHELPLVLMIYNGSSDAFERLESGEFTEYANKIMDRAVELTKIHDAERIKYENKTQI